MKGYIRKRSKGSWEIAIDIGKDPSTGKDIFVASTKGMRPRPFMREALNGAAAEGEIYLRSLLK